MTFNKGDLVTIEPQPMEDIISGQQYFSKFLKETNYLGVVTGLIGCYTRVIWLRHPTKEGEPVLMKTRMIKKIIV